VTTRLYAEFRDESAVVQAARAMRSMGYRSLEAYMPYPVHGIDEALGRRPSRLPLAVFAVGISAAAGAYLLEWYLNAYLYPIDVGSRPPHFPEAYGPIAFEMGVLFAAFTAFFGVLALGRLLRLWHPVFEAEGFASATNDGYWIEVLGSDARFDVKRTTEHLRAVGAARVVSVGGVS
jgi:hypothetical protein